MDQKTKRKIDAVLAEAEALTGAGDDEFAAARKALTAVTTDVLRELAVAAIVDVVRRRQRANVLAIEKASERTPRRSVASNAWKTEEWHEAAAAAQAALLAEMVGNVERYAQALKVEWTAELLASDFALADGTRVTWGEATVEQHKSRAALFHRNAVANAEGAARHVKAIEALRAAGVPTLGDLVGVAA